MKPHSEGENHSYYFFPGQISLAISVNIWIEKGIGLLS